MAENKLKIFKYKGRKITFELGNGQKFVNVNEMAKAFPEIRRPVTQFFRLKQTAKFIDALHNSLKISRDDNSRTPKMRNINSTNLAK